MNRGGGGEVAKWRSYGREPQLKTAALLFRDYTVCFLRTCSNISRPHVPDSHITRPFCALRMFIELIVKPAATAIMAAESEVPTLPSE